MELLLLLCLCVSTWTGKTSADENDVVTVAVSQDSNAILPCSPTTKEDLSFQLFKWTKDGQKVFRHDAGYHYNNGLRGQDTQFKGRVSFFQDRLSSGDASIQIQNVKVKDRGIYSCVFPELDSGSQTFNIKLVVYVTRVAPEGSDVILPCSPIGKDDLRQGLFDWKKDYTQKVFLYANGSHYNNGKSGQHENFKSRVEFFQGQLQFGNASILIKNTKLTDGGIYSCEFPTLQPPVQNYIKLVVGNDKGDGAGFGVGFGAGCGVVLGIVLVFALLNCLCCKRGDGAGFGAGFGAACGVVFGLGLLYFLCREIHPDNAGNSPGDGTKEKTGSEDEPLK